MLDYEVPPTVEDRARMKTEESGRLKEGARCKVIGGVHAGKSGTVTGISTSKTGHTTLTVVKPDGVRFKALAKNIVVQVKS
jgi:ribosomal protein S4E